MYLEINVPPIYNHDNGNLPLRRYQPPDRCNQRKYHFESEKENWFRRFFAQSTFFETDTLIVREIKLLLDPFLLKSLIVSDATLTAKLQVVYRSKGIRKNDCTNRTTEIRFYLSLGRRKMVKRRDIAGDSTVTNISNCCPRGCTPT